MKAVLVCALLVSSPAFADWQANTVTDRMTDKKETIITAPAKQTATRFGRQVSAHLQVECWTSPSFKNKPLPSIVFDSEVALGEIGITYRLDDKPVVQRLIRVTGAGNAVHLALLDTSALTREIAKAKRFRITVFWKLDQPGFYEFDIPNGKEAAAKLACR